MLYELKDSYFFLEPFSFQKISPVRIKALQKYEKIQYVSFNLSLGHRIKKRVIGSVKDGFRAGLFIGLSWSEDDGRVSIDSTRAGASQGGGWDSAGQGTGFFGKTFMTS